MNYSKLLGELNKGAEFKGYTVDELRFMRGCTMARIEMEKQKLNHVSKNFMETGSLSGKSSWMGKVLGAFSYIDYALLAFKLIKGVRAFRRH